MSKRVTVVSSAAIRGASAAAAKDLQVLSRVVKASVASNEGPVVNGGRRTTPGQTTVAKSIVRKAAS